MKTDAKLGLNAILFSIEKAKMDPKIKGVLLKVRSPKAGISTLEEVRTALEDFKSSGKFIISYSDFQDQKAYYFSTVADRMYMNPEGTIEFKGLSAEILFFTKALEKLGIQPEVIRYGKYKSAIEPFTETEMSPANREQMQVLVSNLWKHMLNGISAQRSISVEELSEMAEKLQVSNVEVAENKGLIDGLKYYDELLAELKDSLTLGEDNTIPAIKLSEYMATCEIDRQEKNLHKDNKIAVVYAYGSIVPGEGEEDNIGGDRISRAIRKARTDASVKAIILRVNSGGGSALASDVIWREMDLASKTKPTIVSMGDYAASGGYYISCPANAVVSNATTVTGSIGVFGILANGEKLLEKMGLSTDRVKTGPYSDIGSFTRKLTSYERVVISSEIDNIYADFIHHVADGRKQPVDYIDSIGQGRVWTGDDALQLGLVDMLGGFTAALRIAEDMSGISDYAIMELPENDDPFSQIMKMLQTDVKAAIIKPYLGNYSSFYDALQVTEQFDDPQARMPYWLQID